MALCNFVCYQFFCVMTIDQQLTPIIYVSRLILINPSLVASFAEMGFVKTFLDCGHVLEISVLSKRQRQLEKTP